MNAMRSSRLQPALPSRGRHSTHVGFSGQRIVHRRLSLHRGHSCTLPLGVGSQSSLVADDSLSNGGGAVPLDVRAPILIMRSTDKIKPPFLIGNDSPAEWTRRGFVVQWLRGDHWVIEVLPQCDADERSQGPTLNGGPDPHLLVQRWRHLGEECFASRSRCCWLCHWHLSLGDRSDIRASGEMTALLQSSLTNRAVAKRSLNEGSRLSPRVEARAT
jgi:hypothetical protein